MEQLAVSSDVNPCGKSRAVGALNYIPIIVSLPTSFLYFGENTEQWHRKRTLSGEGGGGGVSFCFVSDPNGDAHSALPLRLGECRIYIPSCVNYFMTMIINCLKSINFWGFASDPIAWGELTYSRGSSHLLILHIGSRPSHQISAWIRYYWYECSCPFLIMVSLQQAFFFQS